MDAVDGRIRARLDRYLDLVERWGLCPWAGPARRDGALKIGIVLSGDPYAGTSRFARLWFPQGARIGLVVIPRDALDPLALRRLRDRLTTAHPAIAIADFHPDGGDPDRADTPARLVALLRRSPDPMLQLVPQAALAALAVPPPVAAPAEQAAMLAGAAAPPDADPRAQIAATNFATVRARGLAALLGELAALRGA